MTPAGEAMPFGGTGMLGPHLITPGPDGNLWFTNPRAYWIGRVTPGGESSRYTGVGGQVYGIAAGRDGNLWFVNDGSNTIGRITTSGVISTFTGPGIDRPREIVASPDGTLWFTNSGTSSIGRITPSGVVSNYPGAPGDVHNFSTIAADARGNLWYTRDGRDQDWMGRITPAGATTTYTSLAVRDPLAITAGPDGNMWFTTLGDSIGYVDTGLLGPLLNVTATATTASSYLTVAPAGQAPLASSLNWTTGETVPNSVTTRLSPAGRIGIRNMAGSVDVIADAAG